MPRSLICGIQPYCSPGSYNSSRGFSVCVAKNTCSMNSSYVKDGLTSLTSFESNLQTSLAIFVLDMMSFVEIYKGLAPFHYLNNSMGMLVKK